ncbi:fructose bisphosphate aldolase [Allorhodopirellula heiligendammensis]|uniref:fructose-bisphosphate aldolase n=1 Tax=Allorhodopirellula heiligendammensis TaxID=2714739 RepID=A0A5C6BY58_9BACT|nr:fructose bisphosphate aldolase [Allorhodopirellula heiligendammensis]TWU16905.1 Fructose-bisphosphate aldolase class 1 [Allorhodopirellula heiligendammensis]
MSVYDEQFEVIRNRPGFIAALDQSGGSTPKALAAYGVDENAWSNEDEMFQVVHEMRTRIITADSFNSTRIVGAILFEDTLNRKIESKRTGDYLWNVKRIAPFLKVDLGLADEADGVQLMKPIPTLANSLANAKLQPVFGTKMRSVIRHASPSGIKAIVDQQFEVAAQIMDAALMPIIEPEIDIHCPEKLEAERLLRQTLVEKLDGLPADRVVMLKLTLPEVDNHYESLVAHHNVLKVVALSGGYSRDEANLRLSRQQGVIASFSRALADGLHADQSDQQFDNMLNESITSIFEASIA